MAKSEESSQPLALDVLDDPRVRFVRIIWVDLVNFVRYRVVPIRHFKRLVASGSGSTSVASPTSKSDKPQGDKNVFEGVRYNPHPGITVGKCTMGLVYLALADGVGPTGEYVYTPDLSTARLLPYAPGHASVMGWFEEKEVTDAAYNANNGFAAALCPRRLLRRIVQDAEESFGVSFLIGFETEVIFLSSVDPITPVNDYGWSESAAILPGAPETEALDEIARALEETGIDLQMYHAEAAPGQYEIVTGPLPPLEACDALIMTREIIMNVAAKHGLRATLAPRVFGNSCGSAAHTHISLRSSSPSLSSIPVPVRVSSPPNVSLTPLQSSFLSGLLAHLPAALAFTLPTRASYARMVDGAWSGGTWAAWGRDNREAPVRLAGRGPSPSPNNNDNDNDNNNQGEADYHFEIKPVDGTASPYLAISALLAAGIAGVRSSAPLTSVGLTVPASSVSEEERRGYGVERRMPLSLEEARAALMDDGVMRQALGEEVVKAYLNVNKTLDEQLRAPTPEETMVKLVKTY